MVGHTALVLITLLLLKNDSSTKFGCTQMVSGMHAATRRKEGISGAYQ